VKKKIQEISKKPFPKFSSEEADFLVGKMREMLGPDITRILDQSDLNPNHMIRFRYIADMCRKTREQKGLSFKKISASLKIPQYRLKQIEEGVPDKINSDILQKYIEFLGVKNDFEEWLKDNRDVYDGLGDGDTK